MQKWTAVKGNDIKNKAKKASVVFEERKMQNKCIWQVQVSD